MINLVSRIVYGGSALIDLDVHVGMYVEPIKSFGIETFF